MAKTNETNVPVTVMRPTVSAEDLFKAWQSSRTLEEAAAKVGMREGSMRQRAFTLRKRGIPLKHFRSGRPTLNVAALAKLAKASES